MLNYFLASQQHYGHVENIRGWKRL